MSRFIAWLFGFDKADKMQPRPLTYDEQFGEIEELLREIAAEAQRTRPIEG